MALKRLFTGEMVHVSEEWVKDGTEANSAILATPQLAGLLPLVDTAHQALHKAQPKAVDPRLAKLQEKAAGLDLRHDEVIRGVYGLLTALASLAGAGLTADGLLRLRDLLFPDGLEATQKSYREEAGAATLLKTRLAADAAAKKQLKDIPVFKHNLSHYIDELFKVAQELGAAEQERAQLAPAAGGSSDAQRTLEARNQWIRAVNALVSVANATQVSEDARRTIFGALQLAEKTADKRKGSPLEVPEEGDEGAGSSAGEEAPPKK